MAIAALVLGIIGLVMAWIPAVNIVGIILGVLALIFGIIAIVKAKKTGTGKGMAIAGVVLAGVTIVAAVIINITVVALLNVAAKESGGVKAVQSAIAEGANEMQQALESAGATVSESAAQ